MRAHAMRLAFAATVRYCSYSCCIATRKPAIWRTKQEARKQRSAGMVCACAVVGRHGGGPGQLIDELGGGRNPA